jgi:ATP-binding cassette, subfamily B, bacterial
MPDPGFVEEDFSDKISLHMWKGVVRHAWGHKKYLVPLMAVALVTAACDASFNLIVRKVIDAAEAGRRADLVHYGLAFLGVITLICTCIWFFIYLAGKCSTGISHDIRRAAFAKLQSLEFGYFDRRPVGWLMARLTSDCQRLSSILSWGLLDVVWGISLMIGIAVILFVLNWKLALVVFSVIPPLAWISVRFQRAMLKSSRRIRKINSQITAGYNEGIMAVRTTKTLVREDRNLAEFQDLSTEMFQASVRNAVQSALYWPLVGLVGATGAGLALWFGGSQALRSAISLGTMIAFINYAGQFFDPIHQLARILTELQGAQAAAERVVGLLDTEPKIKDSPEVLAAMERQARRQAEEETSTNRNDASNTATPVAIDGLPDRIETIEFRNVSFAYKEGQPVLKDFNLTVRAGQNIALVGPTGGGKSTIVALLCRFYEPTSGQILINGVDYRRRSLHWLQSHLGIVLQQPHLFSGTVKENIRYGRLDAGDDDIAWAARLVNAHEFVAAMDKGYDGEVGQGGNRLSVGQKQMISFARAVLANPWIFVMDEATSSVDTETEKSIQHGIEMVLKDRTSFVIAHRLSTIRSADRILFIDKGHIVEQGNHHDLLRLRGRYYELYSNQFTHEQEEHLLGAIRTMQ